MKATAIIAGCCISLCGAAVAQEAGGFRIMCKFLPAAAEKQRPKGGNLSAVEVLYASADQVFLIAEPGLKRWHFHTDKPASDVGPPKAYPNSNFLVVDRNGIATIRVVEQSDGQLFLTWNIDFEYIGQVHELQAQIDINEYTTEATFAAFPRRTGRVSYLRDGRCFRSFLR